MFWSFLFSILQNLRALVAMNENLKSQEQEFKAHCRVSVAWCRQMLNKILVKPPAFPLLSCRGSCPGAVGKAGSPGGYVAVCERSTGLW